MSVFENEHGCNGECFRVSMEVCKKERARERARERERERERETENETITFVQ